MLLYKLMLFGVYIPAEQQCSPSNQITASKVTNFKLAGKSIVVLISSPFPAALALDMAAIGFGDGRNPELAACLGLRLAFMYMRFHCMARFRESSYTRKRVRLCGITEFAWSSLGIFTVFTSSRSCACVLNRYGQHAPGKVAQ